MGLKKVHCTLSSYTNVFLKRNKQWYNQNADDVLILDDDL